MLLKQLKSAFEARVQREFEAKEREAEAREPETLRKISERQKYLASIQLYRSPRGFIDQHGKPVSNETAAEIKRLRLRDNSR